MLVDVLKIVPNNEAPVTFKKRKQVANIRKREQESDEDEDDTVAVQIKKDRKKVNSFSTKRGDRSSYKDEIEALEITYQGTSEMVGNKADTLVTSVLEIDTSAETDARAIWERKKREAELETSTTNTTENGKSIYKGKSTYLPGLQKPEHYAGGGIARGPLRASQSIRVTSRFDYQPDICKDYHDTGYCGYGDSCKFLHDRGDYKSGWQIEKEWEEEQEKKRKVAAGVEEGGEEESFEVNDGGEELPFACFICRNPFTIECSPVVTKCKHYFCSKCALTRAAKTNKCFICNEDTHGTFNIATNIITRLKQKKQNEEDEEENEEEEEEEGDNEEGNNKNKNKNKNEKSSIQSGGWSVVE